MTADNGVEVRGQVRGRFSEIVIGDAMGFVAALQREFGPTRERLLQRRRERQAELDAGQRPDFLPSTRGVREAPWRVAPAPADLQDRRGLPRGAVKATVLIETILAAFEMEEILFELKDHSPALNAGRWDYLFSIIKKFRRHPEFVLPEFDRVLGRRPNQVARLREDVSVAARDLLDAGVAGGAITAAGLRNNVSVALQYLESWLRGTAAVAIFNLMEDVAMAEIARSQVWQWVQSGARLAEGPAVTADLVRQIEEEELGRIGAQPGSRFPDARALFEQVALGEEFAEFLTLPAYERLD
jgi:malate synthase